MLIRAAGAVAWRPGPDGAEILLVHRAKYDDWSLPKGKVEPGEPLPVTAYREVGEESGAAITLGQRLAAVRYKVNGNPKQVDWWVARVTSVDDSAVPNHEVDQVAWLPLAQALKRVSYKQDVSCSATSPLVRGHCPAYLAAAREGTASLGVERRRRRRPPPGQGRHH